MAYQTVAVPEKDCQYLKLRPLNLNPKMTFHVVDS
jgi:hypothetical protein